MKISKETKIVVITITVLFFMPFLFCYLGYLIYWEGIFVKKVYVPKEILENNVFHLGQNISILKKVHKLTEDDSGPTLYFRLNNSEYFSDGFVKTPLRSNSLVYMFSFFFPGNVIRDICIGGPSKNSDKNYNDLVREIINICIQTYGSDYKFFEYELYKDKFEKVIMYWETDSCYVSFTFTPFNIPKELKENYDYSNLSYSLRLWYSDYFFNSTHIESKYWTRENLGLDQ